MTSVLPREIVARIKEETDIVELVRRYVTLAAAGSAFKGLCPFHREKTPSFHVNPTRQIYKCFGCGEGGDAISFVMKVEGLSFPEALETLARPLDIDLSRYLSDDESEGERLAFHRANDQAAALWGEAFWDRQGAEAHAYLHDRGFGDEALRRFEVGFAPAGTAWLTAGLQKRGVSGELALSSGLLGRRGQEPPFAYFRRRLIFPIRNIAQKIVGFGGRILGPGEPKYLNSPDSAYFNKGKLLYGFAASRMAVARLKTAILVEGYLDLIAMAQSGFANVVATCGTAFTPEQARLLRRGCPTVLVMFDGDRAGVSATVRACHVALGAGLEPRVGRLPEGEDPASFLQTRDAAALGEVLERAPGYLAFLLALVEERRRGRTGRERALRQALRSIATAPDPIRQAYLLQEAAELFGIGVGILEREVAALTAQAAGRASPRGEAAAAAPGAGEGGAPGAGTAAAERGPAAASGRPRAPAGPWIDRAAIERTLFAQALLDPSGRAAMLLLDLRGGRPCATAEGDRLLAHLASWREHRAARGEQDAATWVRAGWYEESDRFRAFVSGLLESSLVPDKGDFTRAVSDGHARLEADDELARRRAEAIARLHGRDGDQGEA